MDIDILAHNFAVTPAIRERIERQFRGALDPDHIQKVRVRLSDVNGPRGGPDKQCIITAVPHHGPPIVIRHVSENLYMAVDMAGRLTRQTLRRQASRRRALARRPLARVRPNPREMAMA